MSSLYFRCYEPPSVSSGGAYGLYSNPTAIGIVVFVLSAATAISLYFVFLKYHENRRLRQEILDLQNEAHNKLIENGNDLEESKQEN